MGMKTLWITVLLAFTGLAFAQEAAPTTDSAGDKAAPVPPKLKIRWTEKKKDGKRIVTVYVKNEGMLDLKNELADVVIKGKGERERQKDPIDLSIPRNQEKSFEIVIKQPSGGFVGIANAPVPVGTVVTVEVVIGEKVFAS
jgi:hypothetical protein